MNILKVIQGWVKIKGDTDGTNIGNVDDALKVSGSMSYGSSLQLDPVGRLKVVNANQLYTLTGADYFDAVRYISTTTSGSGAVAGDTNSRSVKISTTTASGDLARVQSRRRVEYNKGNAQEIIFTGRFEVGKANLRQRYGYFCANYGLFFEKDGTTFYSVTRTSTSGTPVDTRTAQSSWNIDKLDGTGPSGVTFDLSASDDQNLFGIDFLWLGTFAVRWFIGYNDQLIHVHTDKYSGQLTVPYMDSGMGPLRAEIENTGTVASSSNMYLTCASVKTYGAQSNIGRIRYVDTALTAITSIGTGGAVVAGIRLNSSYLRGSLRPVEFGIFPTSGNAWGYYKIVMNATLTSPTWSALPGIADGLTNSPAYTASSGSVIKSGYFGTNNKNQANISFDSQLASDVYLGADCSGNADTLVMILYSGSGTFDACFVGAYEEFI